MAASLSALNRTAGSAAGDDWPATTARARHSRSATHTQPQPAIPNPPPPGSGSGSELLREPRPTKQHSAGVYPVDVLVALAVSDSSPPGVPLAALDRLLFCARLVPCCSRTCRTRDATATKVSPQAAQAIAQP